MKYTYIISYNVKNVKKYYMTTLSKIDRFVYGPILNEKDYFFPEFFSMKYVDG